MRGLQKPLTLFTSKKPFNDRYADDMQCGDMDERTLKERFHLDQVSTFVDWCTYRSPYKHMALQHLPPYSKDKVVAMLFDELRDQSRAFSFTGAYQGLIVKLFNHMQYKEGADYSDPQMDQAYKSVIINDKAEGNVLEAIKGVLDTFDFKAKDLTKDDFTQVLMLTHLPKFVGWQACINGLGIAIHDINSTEITIESLTFKENKYTAVIRFKGQDHFGLDKDDISKIQFNAVALFRIWFVLQRADKFAFRPFFTNFEARVIITGENHV